MKGYGTKAIRHWENEMRSYEHFAKRAAFGNVPGQSIIKL